MEDIRWAVEAAEEPGEYPSSRARATVGGGGQSGGRSRRRWSWRAGGVERRSVGVEARWGGRRCIHGPLLRTVFRRWVIHSSPEVMHSLTRLSRPFLSGRPPLLLSLVCAGRGQLGAAAGHRSLWARAACGEAACRSRRRGDRPTASQCRAQGWPAGCRPCIGQARARIFSPMLESGQHGPV
jgi:hypothetical protein